MNSSDATDGPKRVGDFEIIRELGRGGMGVVYEARQRSLNRHVALKVLSTGLGLTTKAIMRFKREAEAAARLHHTNIVPIYSTGDEGRIPYYAMELVNGPSLDQVIQQLRRESDVSSNGSLESTDDGAVEEPSVVPDWVNATVGFEKPSSNSEDTKTTSTSGTSSSLGSGSTSSYFDNVAGMMAGVADALAHAHDQGVIHRDIKPSNLLLSQDGRLSVNDFGLARMLEQPGMTISGELMGSPMYMSPEQITSGRIPLDHRTDIYSLGASLYQMLTLQTPFDGQQRDLVLSQIIHKEPARLRSVNNKIPKDLETICLKAMEKDPDRRYQTADLMAEDLRHFVDRNAISARRVSPLERTTRWARKNKAITAMACITLMVIVSATAFFYLSNRNLRREDAMQQALTAAMSGDVEHTHKYTSEARKHGADEYWELMVESQVHLVRGENDLSLKKLKIVVEHDPDNLTAQFMLAEAFHANAQWEQYAEQLKQFLPKQARTPMEKLFKGSSLYLVSPKEALSYYDDAIEDLPAFDLAWLMRAFARTTHALDQNDESEILLALKEINSAGLRMGEDQPILFSTRLYARLAAYYIFQHREEIARAEEHLHDAAVDVKALARHARYLYGNHLRMHYFHIKEDVKSIEAVFREARKNGNKGYIVDPYATALYSRGRFQDALRELAKMPDQDDYYVGMSQVFCLMEIQGGRDEAEKITGNMLGQGEISRHFATYCLLLLGKKDDAEREAAKLVEKERVIGSWTTRLDTRRYLSGRISEENLIKTVQSSERDQAVAYFVIGLKKLAEGKRKRAQECFERSASSLVYTWTHAQWSRVFAERPRADSNWPDWLPAEPVDAQTE